MVSGLAPGSSVAQAGTLNISQAGFLSNEWARSTSGSPRSSGQYGDVVPVEVNGVDAPAFSFTPATLSRAEKARRYFELASEHRRLLEHLPPLKTDSSAPGNYSMKATSSPGSAHYDVVRVASNTTVKRGLGRPYNPLQALRNRRLRNRERRPLTAPPDTWQETNRIKGWIDGVEAASKEPSFRPGEDQVRLPTFSGETENGEHPRSDTSKKHRRNDTVSSVITRPENGWTIEPAELLADTYWVEKDDNKTIVEDRHGNRIFPNRARLSVEVPRRSKESERRKDFSTERRDIHDESEDDDRSKHRRKNMITIPGRLLRHRASRSGSVSSSSSIEGRKPPAFHFGESEGGDENIGPLERHMKRMISKEERGELSSPEILSPDRWHTTNMRLPNEREGSGTTNRGGTAGDSRLSADYQRHRRARSADGRVGSIDHGLSQMDDLTSNSAASPTLSNAAAVDRHISTKKLATAKASELKSKGSHLPIFRSRSKERNHIEHNDFADNHGTQLSPVLSRESAFAPGRSSLDSSRPAQMKRKYTNESIPGSMRRTNTATTVGESSIKESANAMGRRLGRIGELVKNEGTRLGDRFRGGRDRETAPGMIRSLSDHSETDHAGSGNTQSKNGDDFDGISPRQSLERNRTKPRYHTSGLPTFKSPAARDSSATDNSGSEKAPPPRSRPDTARAADSDRPVPPTIVLPESDSVSDSDVPAVRPAGSRPKSASQAHLSFGAAPATRTGERRGNLNSDNGGRRHWSISDPSHKTQPQLVDEITARDIARVRALLLASGIKAQEIHNKASSTRDKPLPLITKVGEITGQKLDGLTRKEEDLVAGRLLSETISSTLSEFEKTLEQFQSTTVKDLGAQLDELSHRAADQLTKLVHETSDEVDAFNVELTTKQPQEVKRVDEAVDEMFRQRRRQFRLVRRTGFKMLEWLVLGIMWWAWFVVFLFNTFRKGFVTILAALKWLLWF